jgi:hypothetical protein
MEMPDVMVAAALKCEVPPAHACVMARRSSEGDFDLVTSRNAERAETAEKVEPLIITDHPLRFACDLCSHFLIISLFQQT